MAPKGSWLLHQPPDDDTPLLFGFPYAGAGAGSYRNWPGTVAGFSFCALQPPGRENRFREPPLRSHQDWSQDFAAFLAGFTDRRYAFIGHCGGVPLALSSVLAAQDLGLPLPSRLILSSWGPPHRALYGPLNFVDLPTADLHGEVRRLFAGLGAPIREDFVDIAAEVLRVDLELHRPHLYDASRRVPVPVTVVAWTNDEIVPPDQVCQGWEECADVSYETIEGRHFDYLDCPPRLAGLIAQVTGAPQPGDVAAGQ